MLLFKKNTMAIPCSQERLLQMLQRNVYPCSMIRSVFPIKGLDEPFVGSVRQGKVKLRYEKAWYGGWGLFDKIDKFYKSRVTSPILYGTIVPTEDDRCALVYRFFPDSFLFPFFILWLTGMLYMIVQRGGYFYLLLPLLPLPPFFILTSVYSTCSARTIKVLKELILNACQIDKNKHIK